MQQFTKKCEWCETEFKTEWETKSYCSRSHKERAREFRKRKRRTLVKTLVVLTCKGCDVKFTAQRKNQAFCTGECRKWHSAAVKQERDRTHFNQKTPAFKRRIYFKTDGRCGICRELIDLALKYPHPKSFSIDHIVPRSQNGGHSFSNLQPAHLDCNAKRGDSPIPA